MNWNKLRKQIEAFTTPTLIEKIQYLPSGYRYVKDKKNPCYMTVDKTEVFNSNKKIVQWFSNEQEIINDYEMSIYLTEEILINTRKKVGDKVPENRLAVIATKDLKAMYAKKIMTSQSQLFSADFQGLVNRYLSEAVEVSLKSDNIVLNVLAILDRRVGKKRLRSLRNEMLNKHPIVLYFYNLRIDN